MNRPVATEYKKYGLIELAFDMKITPHELLNILNAYIKDLSSQEGITKHQFQYTIVFTDGNNIPQKAITAIPMPDGGVNFVFNEAVRDDLVKLVKNKQL
jgi:hypothetical protein